MSLYCQPFGPITSFFWPCLQYHQKIWHVFLYHQIFGPGFSSPNFSLDIPLLLSPILGTILCHQNLCRSTFHQKWCGQMAINHQLGFISPKLGGQKVKCHMSSQQPHGQSNNMTTRRTTMQNNNT